MNINLSLAGACLVFFILFYLEWKRPWHLPQRDLPRIRTNVILLILGFVSMSTLVPFGFSAIFSVIGPINRTAFDFIDTSIHFKVVAGILIFDLKNYAFHRIIHKVKWLWKFHQIHHSDVAVDVFTTQRFHPVELLFGFLPALVPIFVGVPWIATGLIEVVALPWVLFQHSNIALPTKLEKFLSYIFLTPGLHKIHHSIDSKDANVNFGVIFSFWDRLFGTYLEKPEKEMNSLEFGVSGFSNIEETKELSRLLKLPFISDARFVEPLVIPSLSKKCDSNKNPSSLDKIS